MCIIVVDDESLLMKHLVKIISELEPNAKLYGFTNCEDVIQFINDNHVDIAFLDIQMIGINGMELAGILREKFPKINIIFTTGYDNYAVDAFKINASSYLMKPITKDAVEKALKDLRYNIEDENSQKIRFQCFGNFECFINNVPLDFTFSKTKELLAYIVYKNGSLCSNEELLAVLWEDDKDHFSYFKQIRQDLEKTFEEKGCENILVRQRGKLGIRTDKVLCDFYDYLNGKPVVIKEFMTQYSWAEDLTALLQNS